MQARIKKGTNDQTIEVKLSDKPGVTYQGSPIGSWLGVVDGPPLHMGTAFDEDYRPIEGQVWIGGNNYEIIYESASELGLAWLEGFKGLKKDELLRYPISAPLIKELL